MMGLLSGLVGRLPPSWLHRIGAVLGWLTFSVLCVRRRVALQNLSLALGLTRAEAVGVARRVYRHLCVGALEILRVGTLTREVAQQVLGQAGTQQIRDHLSRGKGLLVLSAHLGQWDLLACAAARCGLKVNVVTRSIKTGWLNRFWMDQRRACGVRLLPARGSARAVVAALRRNEVVALVLDQHEPGGAVVPFFGRPAATATGLARLARATGAPVLPMFLLREGTGYRLVVEPEVVLPRTEDRRRDLLESTARFTAIIEAQIRSNPDQWLWLHRRWKVVGLLPTK